YAKMKSIGSPKNKKIKTFSQEKLEIANEQT
ncbi:unnamed protein product, partial [marine sediment metagenome]